jgi:HK97 family phage prohead protease
MTDSERAANDAIRRRIEIARVEGGESWAEVIASRSKPKLRSTDGKSKIVGTPIVYDSWSVPIDGYFRERIRPGAFDAWLRDKPDIVMTVNHDASKLLGRTSSGTLRLNPGKKGISVECDLSDTSYCRDVAESIRRGDIRGMSFIFRPVKDRWYREGGEDCRDVLEAKLYEVSAVTDPAYLATDVSLRSDWRIQAAHRRRLLDLAVRALV